MKLFKNLKIGQKLIFCFLLVSFLIGIVGYVGVANMKKININVKTMYEDDLQGIIAINAIKSNLLRIRSNVLLILDESNHSNIDSLQTEISDLAKQNDTLIESYNKHITTSEDRTYFDEFLKLLNKYRTERGKLVEFAKNKEYDEAKQLFPSVSATRETMELTLDKLVALNENISHDSYTKSTALFNSSLRIIIGIIAAGIMLSIVLGTAMSIMLSKQINRVLRFSQALKSGDLSQSIVIDSKDELGKLGASLNSARDTMRGLISEILSGSENISTTSEELSATIEEISFKMEIINSSTKGISVGAEELSSTAEEVNASVEEISVTTEQLSHKAEESSYSSVEIGNRASKVKNKGTSAIENSRVILKEKHTNIIKAIENGKVVEEITAMADAIGSIADQTNLLALNAAIEAARAGDQGRGFAVVADEVRKLAEESSSTVSNIQNVTNQVKTAFVNLSENAQGLLSFIENNVNPDYELLIDTAKQYEQDAKSMRDMAEEIASAAKLMKESLGQVSEAVENVTATTQESASSSTEILGSVEETTVAIGEVAKSAQNQAELAEKLNLLIQKFKV